MISCYPVHPRGSKLSASTQNRGLGNSTLLTPDINSSRSRGRSISSSGRIQLQVGGIKRPPSACSSAGGDIGQARSLLGTVATSVSQSQTAVELGGSVQCSPGLSDSSLEESISAGVRHQRTYSGAGLGDPTMLTPSHTKRLKIYAKKVAEENDVPEQGLFNFIDTGGIYYMLIDLKSFIKDNSSIFKVPLSLFEDIHLSALFASIVSDLLSSIRGSMKSKLLSSIRKCMSIMDTVKSLAHGCIKVDAAHWNRLAFLRCLRIFMIGTGDHRVLLLKTLYSHSLISSLHSAVCARIRPKLGIDIDSIEHELYGDEVDYNIPDSASATNEPQEINDTDAGGFICNGNSPETGGLDENLGGNGDMDLDYEPEDNEGVDTTVLNGRPLHSDNSGFGDNGKIWNFVNISLENIRKIAKEEAAADQSGCTGYETAFRQIQVEYFQQDLTEFPSNMVIPKLLASNAPQWQTTLQNTLLWNED
ncbi:hypothetical protein BDR07DRAFT_1379827 [Suillus spraguei]|nr:hypothetical protein BDR07DRAFT_1379827 [Suillus spraguei]